MSGVLLGLVELLASVVAPPRCAACDAAVRRRVAFCASCAATLERAVNPTGDQLAAFVYGGAIAQALRRFKFDDRPDLAPALVAGFLPHLTALGAEPPDVVVPVPLHPTRLVERGYNQAALLARPLASWLRIPCLYGGLRRRIATQRQTDLTRTERAANVAEAFLVAHPRKVLGCRVLLVDDVETTGSTLEGCRRALRLGGARSVCTIVVARAETS